MKGLIHNVDETLLRLAILHIQKIIISWVFFYFSSAFLLIFNKPYQQKQSGTKFFLRHYISCFFFCEKSSHLFGHGFFIGSINYKFRKVSIWPTINCIIFWDFLMFYRFCLSPQVKRCAIITDRHGIYKFPHEFLIDLRPKILGN